MPTKRTPITRRASGPVSAEAWLWLDAMFKADTSADGYRKRFAPYHEVKLGTGGLKPWWPPLSEVWAQGAEPPATWHGSHKTWKEAHAFVDKLFGESLLARPMM